MMDWKDCFYCGEIYNCTTASSEYFCSRECESAFAEREKGRPSLTILRRRMNGRYHYKWTGDKIWRNTERDAIAWANILMNDSAVR